MDEETWDDPGVAAAVERAAVPMRVDADARPDVYGRYHLGGLPTTALLTADGAFVRGGTFLSPPQLFAFLDAALADFKANRRPAPRPATSRRRPASLVDEVIARLVRRADLDHGGFGHAPRLPETEALTLILGRWRETRDAALERILRTTLDAIVEHLADPRDGGFFRYAAAPDWSGPHTEKVTVDQARLTCLCLEAGPALGEPRYLEAARRSLAHARLRLADREGRVLASVAADSAYYARAGDPDDAPAVDPRRFADAGAAMLAAAWLGFAVTGEPPGLEPEYRIAAPDGAIPHRLDRPDALTGFLADQALGIAATLLEYRLGGRSELLAWARRAADWSFAHLWDEGAGAFRAASGDGGPPGALPAMFPLLANGEMAQALADLSAHTGEARYRDHARRVVDALGPQALTSPAGPAVALAARRLEAPCPDAELRGRPGAPGSVALARAVIRILGPAATVRWVDGEHPSVVVCAGDLCLPPVADERALRAAMIAADLAPGGILSSQSPDDRRP